MQTKHILMLPVHIRKHSPLAPLLYFDKVAAQSVFPAPRILGAVVSNHTKVIVTYQVIYTVSWSPPDLVWWRTDAGCPWGLPVSAHNRPPHPLSGGTRPDGWHLGSRSWTPGRWRNTWRGWTSPGGRADDLPRWWWDGEREERHGNTDSSYTVKRMWMPAHYPHVIVISNYMLP